MKKLFSTILHTAQLIVVFFSTALFMSAYEFLKEIYFQGKLTLWESHTITVLVTAVFATIAAYLIRKQANKLVQDSHQARLKVTSIIKHLFDAVII